MIDSWILLQWIGILGIFFVVLLPITAYLCMKAGTVGYWKGFVYCVKNGVIPLPSEEIEEH